MKRFSVIVVSLFLFIPLCRIGAQPFADQKTKDSYSLGYDFGSNIKRQGVDIDLPTLMAAIQDALENRQPVIGPEDIRQNLMEMRKKLMVRQDQLARRYADTNLKEGKAFLEQNKRQEGVREMKSGLQYKVLVEGSGTVPKPSDFVTVHYRGTLINGKEFDNSYTRGNPASLPLSSLMRGWQEALLSMKTGAKWQIFVSPDLAYGRRQSSRVPPQSTLIFEIELLGIDSEANALKNESAVSDQSLVD